MRVFVTGASGFIGSAVVPELLGAGHEVIGLARSQASADALTAAGATVQRGDLTDLDSLRAGAAASDGVIHLAFVHDFTDFAAANVTDRQAIDALGAELAGSGRPLVIASGLAGFGGAVATEDDEPDAATAGPRAAAAAATLALADRGVRSSVVRLAPTVHGAGDGGFIAAAIGVARQSGVAGYVGDRPRWAAVHRLDAARLFRLAVEQAPAGSVLHGTAEDGVDLRDVAAVVGRHLGLPVQQVTAEHFGWLGMFIGTSLQGSSAKTRALLGWEPTHPGLLDDLEQGHYFTTA